MHIKSITNVVIKVPQLWHNSRIEGEVVESLRSNEV